jgi:DNA-binding IclR family transcriptional regulator
MRVNSTPREIRVQTVERSLLILEIMARQNAAISLTQIGKLVKLNLSTTYRLLNALCRSGFVEREKTSGNYRLGLKAFLIGNTVLQRIDLREIALPFLTELVQSCNESAYLAILSNQDVVYTDGVKTTGPIQISIQTGLQVPACQTGAGKMLLAGLEPRQQSTIANQYAQENVIKNSQDFLTELNTLRRQQYSAGVSSFNAAIHELSVPVYSYSNQCAGTVSVFYQNNGPDSGDRETGLLEQVRETAGKISRAMGYYDSLQNQSGQSK